MWALPALAAAVGVAVVAARARALEEAATGLAAEVRELSRLRGPLARLRRATAETEARVGDLRAAHAAEEPGNGA